VIERLLRQEDERDLRFHVLQTSLRALCHSPLRGEDPHDLTPGLRSALAQLTSDKDTALALTAIRMQLDFELPEAFGAVARKREVLVSMSPEPGGNYEYRPPDPVASAGSGLLGSLVSRLPDRGSEEQLADLIRGDRLPHNPIALAVAAYVSYEGIVLTKASPLIPALIAALEAQKDSPLVRCELVDAIQTLAGRDFCFKIYRKGMTRDEWFRIVKRDIETWAKGE